MTAVPGLWELQKGILTKLAANAAIQSLLGNPARIYDAPPTDATFPFILIGDAQAQEWGARDFAGMEVVLSLHAIANLNRGSGDIKQINDAARIALHDQAITIAAGTVIQCLFDSQEDESLTEDGLTWRGTIKFHIFLQLT